MEPVMRRFAIVGHRATTDHGFSLNDMPGSAGRMDVLCRCVNAGFFLSHDLRRDVECYLILKGGPETTILFKGDSVRSLNPDERSAGALIKKALGKTCGSEFIESSPGVFIRRGGLARLLSEYPFAVLDESGDDIRIVKSLPENLLLSDHQNFTEEEEAMTADLPRLSVGPRVLHADHTITIYQNEADRRSA